MIMRRHHSISDRPRTRDSGWCALAVANISLAFLNCRRVGRTAPGSGSARAMPRLHGLTFRFFASSTSDHHGSIDAGSIFKNLGDPLVSCIDAERAAI